MNIDTADSKTILYNKMHYQNLLETSKGATIPADIKATAHQGTLPRGRMNRAENSLQTKSYHAAHERHYASSISPRPLR